MRRNFEAQAQKLEVEKLVSEIASAKGDERKTKLEQLIAIAPDSEEFPDELALIREEKLKQQKLAEAKEKSDREAELQRKKMAAQEQKRIATEAALAEFKWKYQITNDELTDKPTYVAWAQSLNRVSFNFPYEGAQRGKLVLRTHPQYGKDLILRVDRGQMLVRSYEDTTVKVVFDSGSPITFKVAGPADHGSTSLFFRDYHGFVKKMLAAKKLKISVPFYQQGDVVFEFNISDFDTDQYLGKN